MDVYGPWKVFEYLLKGTFARKNILKFHYNTDRIDRIHSRATGTRKKGTWLYSKGMATELRKGRVLRKIVSFRFVSGFSADTYETVWEAIS